MNEIDLGGKVAIVTGAGGGMGRVMALSLAGAGARVVAVDIREEQVGIVAAEAETQTGEARVLPVVADVGVLADCDAAVARAVTAFGTVHVLVNNAGVGMSVIRRTYQTDPVKFWDIEVDRWQRMMDTNLKGPLQMARAATPHMIAQGWGRIINVTTSLDTMLRGSYSPYGTSKAGLEAATSCWAKDLAGTGVTANVLVPGGPVNTDFIPPDAPFDRDKLIQPDVMAAPVRWIASDASDGVTDRRFVGRDFDPALPPDEAAANANTAAAWTGFGTQAAWPGA